MGSGTTWLSQIANSLRSNGSMQFDEITQAVPWIHAAHSCGQNLDARQNFTPRLFKSHQVREFVPDGSRYVVLLRDPKDILTSQWNHFSNSSWSKYVGNKPGGVSLEEFAAGMFAHQDGNDAWRLLAS
ncbi:unnamed protein product, partial [Polarella glacialis]